MKNQPPRLWIADMARGDAADRESVFNRLWESFQPRLRAYLAAAFPRDRGNHEDRIQEIFIKVFEKLDTYNPVFSFSTWLFRIARNHCLDAERKRGVMKTDIDPDGLASNQPGPEEALLKAEANVRLRTWLEALSAVDREICYLRFFEGLKYRQIADILKRPAGTIKFSVHELKAKLRLFMEGHDDQKN